MSSGAIAFAIVAGVAILELVLAMTWNRTYYSFGLPIFIRRIERSSGLAGVSLDDLKRASAGAVADPFAFHPLDPNRIAFREQGMGGFFHYTPVMRGLIRHTPEEASVVVLGFVNWFAVVLPLVLFVLLGRTIVVVAPYLFGGLALLYFIQAVRFARVAATLRKQSNQV